MCLYGVGDVSNVVSDIDDVGNVGSVGVRADVSHVGDIGGVSGVDVGDGVIGPSAIRCSHRRRRRLGCGFSESRRSRR